MCTGLPAFANAWSCVRWPDPVLAGVVSVLLLTPCGILVRSVMGGLHGGTQKSVHRLACVWVQSCCQNETEEIHVKEWDLF